MEQQWPADTFVQDAQRLFRQPTAEEESRPTLESVRLGETGLAGLGYNDGLRRQALGHPGAGIS
jgi:hypothetical protein